MDFHPYADVWPLMEGEPFAELVADIRKNGLIYPPKTYQDKILDGRNRYRAYLEVHGKDPVCEDSGVTNDRAAIDLSIALNMHRRHLSKDALAFVAEGFATLTQGLNKRYAKKDSADALTSSEKEPLSQSEAAAKIGVSVDHVKRARAVVDYKPELKEAVLSGKKTLNAAAVEAREVARTKKAQLAAKIAAKAKPPGRKPIPTRVLPPGRKLTVLDVDPDWTGTDAEFTTEYGHVQIMTSQERSTMHFGSWAIGIGHIVRELKGQQLPKISERCLYWLRTPKAADVIRLRTAVSELEQGLATARRLLAKLDEVK